MAFNTKTGVGTKEFTVSYTSKAGAKSEDMFEISFPRIDHNLPEELAMADLVQRMGSRALVYAACFEAVKRAAYVQTREALAAKAGDREKSARTDSEFGF